MSGVPGGKKWEAKGGHEGVPSTSMRRYQARQGKQQGIEDNSGKPSVWETEGGGDEREGGRKRERQKERKGKSVSALERREKREERGTRSRRRSRLLGGVSDDSGGTQKHKDGDYVKGYRCRCQQHHE